jgi:hypothetical protein
VRCAVRLAARDDELQALAAGEAEPLDGKAEDCQLARRRVAGARGSEAHCDERHEGECAAPACARLVVVDEEKHRPGWETMLQFAERGLSLGRTRGRAEERDDRRRRRFTLPG